MNFESVHIHKTRKESYEHLLFLLIPMLLFLLSILFVASKNNSGKVSGASTKLETLTTSPEK